MIRGRSMNRRCTPFQGTGLPHLVDRHRAARQLKRREYRHLAVHKRPRQRGEAEAQFPLLQPRVVAVDRRRVSVEPSVWSLISDEGLRTYHSESHWVDGPNDPLGSRSSHVPERQVELVRRRAVVPVEERVQDEKINAIRVGVLARELVVLVGLGHLIK